MYKGICYIAAASGESCRFDKGGNDLVIAADAGYSSLINAGMTPDLAVGDFDSLGTVPDNIPVVRHPSIKDDTDTMLAVKLGLERGYRDFRIYGGMGGRLDHTVANIQTIAYITDHGARGFLVGERECLTVIKNSQLRFTGKTKGTVSVFAYGGEAYGVDIAGLFYPLSDYTLTPSFPIGVSNEFTGQQALIGVKQGRLLIIWSGKIDIVDMQ